MRAAANFLILLIALTGCNAESREAQANNAAATDIEALPPDESVATPTEELANGAAEPSENGAPTND